MMSLTALANLISMDIGQAVSLISLSVSWRNQETN